MSGDTTPVCPHCDGTQIRYAQSRRSWVCEDCGRDFETPDQRERLHPAEVYSGHIQLRRAGFEHLIEEASDD